MPNAVADLFAIISIYINFCRNLPVSLLNGRIILCRGIDILMAQNICNKADVAGFLIKGGSLGAAGFMGGDMRLHCCGFRQLLSRSTRLSFFPVSL